QIINSLIRDAYKIEFAADQSYSDTLDHSSGICNLEYHYFYSNSYWLEGWNETFAEFYDSDCLVGNFDYVDDLSTTGQYNIWMKVTRDDFWHTTAIFGFLVDSIGNNNESTYICQFPMFAGEIKVWFEILAV
ncbi:MAG: hypothetical protein ACTSVZ_01965, partial [Promethearchaeota archaeon]